MTIASEITALNTNLSAAKDAVTAKGGTTGNTGLAGLATEIASIPAGGSAPVEKDVNFFDYDGTLIAGYTIAEAHALSELPTPPAHSEFTFEAWTETLATVKATTKQMDVGATYSWAANRDATVVACYPINGHTITVKIRQDVDNGTTINWGDGTPTETISGTGNITLTHVYSATVTDFPCKIVLVPSEGVTLTLGASTASSNRFIADTGLGYDLKTDYLIIGKATVYNINYLKKLSYLLFSPQATISSSVSNILLNYASLRASILASQNVTATLNTGTSGAYRLKKYIFGVGIPVNSNMGSFSGDYSLGSLVVPTGTTSLTPFTSCYNLTRLFLPASVTTIDSNVFYDCLALEEISFEDRATIPSTFAQKWFNVGSSDYVNAPNILNFSLFTQVPTLGDASAFLGNLPSYVKILVPSSLESSWKAASGWSDYASQIVGV